MDPRPSAAEAAGDGEPDRKVPAARQAGAVVAAGAAAVADDPPHPQWERSLKSS